MLTSNGVGKRISDDASRIDERFLLSFSFDLGLIFGFIVVQIEEQIVDLHV
jgi:hypothetical protein